MTAKANPRTGWRYRTNVAARVVAGTIGAYAIAALAGAVLARTLPMPRVEAIIPATLIAFLLSPVVTIWAFLARGPWRAWAVILIVAAALYALLRATGTPA